MNRRSFLKAGTAGLAMATGPGLLLRESLAKEQIKSSEKVDPDDCANRAMKYFVAGKKTCCESVLLAGCDLLGVKSALVPDICLGMAGGIGLQGKTCGVVTSAVMILGVGIGRKENDYARKKTRVFQAVGEFCKHFESKFGSTDCRKISGLDLTTAEGRKTLKERVKMEKCVSVVKQGARILAQFLV